jgi:hypothetical protein
MCLIVDANLCSIVFKKTSNQSYKELRTAIFSNRLTLLHGGKLTDEYARAGVLDVIASLSRSGRAVKISGTLIDAELELISGLCVSNDEHVIALARADRKRAHLLCSDDEQLQTDFKTKSLVDKPRGKIYSPTRHKESIRNC